MRSYFRLVYNVVLGLAGLAALVALTDLRTLPPVALPLVAFILLSFIVKRAGVDAGPDTLHSLVGIVDLAAVLIFSPVPGAWVPALSSLLYVVAAWVPDENRDLRTLAESGIGNPGTRGLIGLISGWVYLSLGGTSPPADLVPANALPMAAAVLAWYLLDNLAWAIAESLRLGVRDTFRLFRDTLGNSLLVELIPLPFSMVIAVVYTAAGGIGGAIFVLLAAALVEAAFVVQRYADVEHRLRHRTDELAALNEFSQAVSRAGFDTDRVIELLMEYAQRISAADLYRLELLSAKHDAILMSVQARGGRLDWSREEQPLSPALAALRDNPASLLIRDLEKEKPPFEAASPVDGQPARSAIYLPLLSGAEVIGVLTVLGTRPGQLSRQAARNLSSMTTQAAIALENSHLYSIEQRRATQLALVSEVSRQVVQFLDLDELLQQVVREIRDRFGYSNVHVFARNEDNELIFRASTHPDLQAWQASRERIPSGQGIAGWVLMTGEPLLAPDVSKEPRYLTGPVGLAETRSELAVPLKVGTNVLGVLDVQSEVVGRFGEEDLFLLGTLAAQIGIAIEDARLYAGQKEEAWYLNVLLQVSENLSATATLDEALETIVRITPILVGVARCAILLYDPADDTMVGARQYGLDAERETRFAQLRIKMDARAPQSLQQLWKTREPVSVDDLEPVRPEESLARSFGLESVLLTPLIYRGDFVGAMVVDQGPRPRRFTTHEIRVVMGISNQAAVAIQNARLNEQAEVKKRLDYEIGLARRIQTSFLPPCCPELLGYQLSAAWRAAREVSGDFYDFVNLAHDRIGITIADVSDKGMPAALFMVLTRTLLRAMAIGKPTPQDALERANDLILSDSQTDMFATAFYTVLNGTTGELTYSNAGHNPPLLYRRIEEDLIELKGHGLALGVLPGIHIPERRANLQPGDTLVMYTDGITEALAPTGEEYGAARLADLIAANNRMGAVDLVDEILRSVDDFTGGAPQLDDMTLIVLQREPNGSDGGRALAV